MNATLAIYLSIIIPLLAAWLIIQHRCWAARESELRKREKRIHALRPLSNGRRGRGVKK